MELGPPIWHWENPTPSGWAVYGLWGTSATDVYGVGAYGNLLHWDGTSWQEARVGDEGDHRSIWGSSDTDVFVVSDRQPEIIHFDGESWGSTASPTALPLYAVWGSSSHDVYAAGGRYWNNRQGVLLHYDGSEWTVLRDDLGESLAALWGSGPEDVFVGGQNGILLHYDGATYTPIPGATGDITAITGTADDVLVFTADGQWYTYDRESGQLVETGQVPGAQAAWGTLSDLYVAGGATGIHHYDGQTWTTEVLPSGAETFAFYSVWGSEDGVLFVGGDGAAGWDSAGVLRHVGDEWVNDSALLTPEEFYDVWALSRDLAYAVGNGGTLAQWDGEAWSLLDLSTTTSLYGVWAADEDDVYVSSRSDTLYHFDGASWTETTIPGANDLRPLRGSSSTNVYVGGGSWGSAELYRFDGTTWEPQTVPSTISYVTGIWIDPVTASAVLAGRATENGTGVFVRGTDETEWTQLSTPLMGAARTVGGTSLEDLYAVTDSEVFHYDGEQWTLVATSPTNDYFTGLWARATDDVWAVGYDSVIMHFDGNAWDVVQNRDSGWELMAVHGSSATDVLVVGESGTILRYGPLAR